MQTQFKRAQLALSRYSVMVNSSILIGWAIANLLHPRIASACWLATIPLTWVAWLYLVYQENVLLGDLSVKAKAYWWSMPIAMTIAFILGSLL